MEHGVGGTLTKENSWIRFGIDRFDALNQLYDRIPSRKRFMLVISTDFHRDELICSDSSTDRS